MAKRLLVSFIMLFIFVSCAGAPEPLVPKEDVGSYIASANRAADIEDYDTAIANLTRAIESPDASKETRAEAYFNRGNMRLKKGDQGSAMDDYTNAIELDPKLSAAYKNRGNIFFEKGQHQRAIEDYDRAISLSPKDPGALNDRANALYMAGQYKNAVMDYNAALRLNPNDATVLDNLAWVYATCKDDMIRDADRALALAMQSIEYTKGDDPERMTTLAAAYAEAGMFEDAVKTQQKAFDLIKLTGTWNDIHKYNKMLESYQAKKPWREGGK